MKYRYLTVPLVCAMLVAAGWWLYAKSGVDGAAPVVAAHEMSRGAHIGVPTMVDIGRMFQSIGH